MAAPSTKPVWTIFSTIGLVALLLTMLTLAALRWIPGPFHNDTACSYVADDEGAPLTPACMRPLGGELAKGPPQIATAPTQ
jgi:hypothetical protein